MAENPSPIFVSIKVHTVRNSISHQSINRSTSQSIDLFHDNYLAASIVAEACGLEREKKAVEWRGASQPCRDLAESTPAEAQVL